MSVLFLTCLRGSAETGVTFLIKTIEGLTQGTSDWWAPYP